MIQHWMRARTASLVRSVIEWPSQKSTSITSLCQPGKRLERKLAQQAGTPAAVLVGPNTISVPSCVTRLLTRDQEKRGE